MTRGTHAGLEVYTDVQNTFSIMGKSALPWLRHIIVRNQGKILQSKILPQILSASNKTWHTCWPQGVDMQDTSSRLGKSVLPW